MDKQIEAKLQTTINNWELMLNPKEDSLSDEFMTSFYELTGAFRQWVNLLNPRPTTLEELLQLSLTKQILSQLPSDLHLNFTTEAELIVENKTRNDPN